ncbi:WW domain-containing protein [Trichostrongylus colubriformis]|uniref:WW domain-containing protein n=2 Tax=Trichostrongylus colubriformis TaxID=6319 RepID=A0AAN8FXD1_TRICO
MVKEIKEFGSWSEQTSSSGRKYFYNRDTEVSQWEKPKEWREYELRLAEQERLSAEQERIQQQVQQQHSVVPPPPMFMTPPPFAFPPPFAPPGFAVGPMNAPPPPFPPYNQFQPPPSIPYPIPPRISSTISAPINTSFPPPPHPPAAPSPRVTQGLPPPPLIPPIVSITSMPSAPHIGAHFSPIQYTAPPPGTGAPPLLHPLNPPIPAPPPAFVAAVPLASTSAPHQHDTHVPHLSRIQRSPQTPQPTHQQHHSQPPSHTFSRDRSHVERSPRATPPSSQQQSRHVPVTSSASQQVPVSQANAESSATVIKKEPREKVNDDSNGRATPVRNRQATETPNRAGPVKRERPSSDAVEETVPSTATEEDDKKPPAKKSKEEDAVTSWRTFYNAELARQKEIELNLDIDPEMRDLVAQSLTLENKLVAELIKMKTAAALVAVQENEVCICNAKIQSLRELRNDLESRQSRLMAPAVVTMPDLNSRA